MYKWSQYSMGPDISHLFCFFLIGWRYQEKPQFKQISPISLLQNLKFYHRMNWGIFLSGSPFEKVNFPGEGQVVINQSHLRRHQFHRLFPIDTNCWKGGQKSRQKEKECPEQGVSLHGAVWEPLTGLCHVVILHFVEASI